jgi:ABC-type transporter Mla subunit MlaD
VRLASQGITGQAYLETDFITATGQRPIQVTWTPRYPVIPSAPSILSRLQETAEGVLNKLASTNPDTLIANVTQLVQELRDTNHQLQGLIAGPELHGTLADAAGAAASVHRLADTAGTGLSQILVQLGDSATKLDAVASQLADATKGGELTRALHNAEAITRQVQQATQSLPAVSDDVQRTIRRVDNLVASSQRDIASTLDNLNAASTNLREFSESAKRYPSQVLFGAPPPREGAYNSR